MELAGRAATQFKAGQVANPAGVSGRSRKRQRLAGFLAAFERVHGRPPDEVEAASLRSAVAMACQIEAGRLGPDDLVRTSHALQRLIDGLG
jgi:hypothetical protein